MPAGHFFRVAVSPDTQHFAEGKGQIIIQIQNSVHGKNKGPCDKQIDSAPEAVYPLGDSDLQFPEQAAARTAGRLDKSKSYRVAAYADFITAVSGVQQTAHEAFRHFLCMQGNADAHGKAFRPGETSHFEGGKPPVSGTHLGECLIVPE